MRGFFFHEHGRWLPETKPNRVELYSSQDGSPPDLVIDLMGEQRRGHSPEAVNYRYAAPAGCHGQFWLYLIWDRVIFVAFHNPECACQACLATLGSV